MHLTDRCTLRCRHCFIGPQTGTDLPLAEITRLADEFAALQGLRFIVSGGEPMLHRHFWRLNDRLPAYPFRSILLTNGTLLDREAARALRFHEVQVSLDGPRDAHDLLRGTGSFRRAIAALRHLAEAGVPISVASVVFAGNLERFDELEAILEEFPLRGWSIDVPCPAGAMADNPALLPDPARAAALMGRSYGGGLLRLERRLGLRGAPGRRHGGRHDRQVRLFHRPALRATSARGWRPRGGRSPAGASTSSPAAARTWPSAAAAAASAPRPTATCSAPTPRCATCAGCPSAAIAPDPDPAAAGTASPRTAARHVRRKPVAGPQPCCSTVMLSLTKPVARRGERTILYAGAIRTVPFLERMVARCPFFRDFDVSGRCSRPLFL